jgi:hypothetical protein
LGATFGTAIRFIFLVLVFNRFAEPGPKRMLATILARPALTLLPTKNKKNNITMETINPIIPNPFMQYLDSIPFYVMLLVALIIVAGTVYYVRRSRINRKGKTKKVS